MQRVAILGSGGAGKSALAAANAARADLPVVHLDVVYWKPGWTPPLEEEFAAALDHAVAGERWILDGNFLRHGEPDPRFARADTVIFLDLPEGCRESIDLEFMRWVWRYPRRNRPRVLALLDGLDGVDVRRLRSTADVRRYVDAL